MSQPSPAPWHTGGNGTIVYDRDGQPVASATVYHGRAQPETALANAELIARAPHLLEMLRAALPFVEEGVNARERLACNTLGENAMLRMHRATLAEIRSTVEAAKELQP